MNPASQVSTAAYRHDATELQQNFSKPALLNCLQATPAGTFRYPCSYTAVSGSTCKQCVVLRMTGRRPPQGSKDLPSGSHKRTVGGRCIRLFVPRYFSLLQVAWILLSSTVQKADCQCTTHTLKKIPSLFSLIIYNQPSSRLAALALHAFLQ